MDYLKCSPRHTNNIECSSSSSQQVNIKSATATTTINSNSFHHHHHHHHQNNNFKTAIVDSDPNNNTMSLSSVNDNSGNGASSSSTTKNTTSNATSNQDQIAKNSQIDMALVWNLMMDKDAAYHKLRNSNMMGQHPTIQPSYRIILFSWLSQVSQECKLHKQTYHLAIDFFDRYLVTQKNIHKLQMQLIGTTCIFIASKFEEIHPPTVYEFAEFTDGACTAEEILEQELIILGAIRWQITPITPSSWLNTYAQLYSSSDKENTTRRQRCPWNVDIKLVPQQIIVPNFKMIVCLVDLALLDINSLNYANSKLAAAALYHFTDETTLVQCSGFKIKDIIDCVHWLKPFAQIVREHFQASCSEKVEPLFCDNNSNSSHCSDGSSTITKEDNMQMIDNYQMHQHRADESMLQMVHDKIAQDKELLASSKRIKLEYTSAPTGPYIFDELSPEKPTSLLTPPRSSRKRKYPRK